MHLLVGRSNTAVTFAVLAHIAKVNDTIAFVIKWLDEAVELSASYSRAVTRFDGPSNCRE